MCWFIDRNIASHRNHFYQSQYITTTWTVSIGWNAQHMFSLVFINIGKYNLLTFITLIQRKAKCWIWRKERRRMEIVGPCYRWSKQQGQQGIRKQKGGRGELELVGIRSFLLETARLCLILGFIYITSSDPRSQLELRLRVSFFYNLNKCFTILYVFITLL